MQLVVESVVPLVVNLVDARIGLANGMSPDGPMKVIMLQGDGMEFRVPLSEQGCDALAAGLKGIQIAQTVPPA